MRSQSRGARPEEEEDEDEEEGVSGAACCWATVPPAPPATPQRQHALRARRASGHGSIGGGPSVRGRSCRPILLLPGRLLHSLAPRRSSGTALPCNGTARSGEPVRPAARGGRAGRGARWGQFGMDINQVQPHAKGRWGFLWGGCWGAEEGKAVLRGEPCIGHGSVVPQEVRVYGVRGAGCC